LCNRQKGPKWQQEDEGKEQKEKRENGWRLKGIERRKRELKRHQDEADKEQRRKEREAMEAHREQKRKEKELKRQQEEAEKEQKRKDKECICCNTTVGPCHPLQKDPAIQLQSGLQWKNGPKR